MDFPESKDLFTRYYDRLAKYYNKNFVKDPIFIVEIGDKIRVGWSKIDSDDTTTFNNCVYDVVDTVQWYSYPVLFVRRGIRPPINFKNYANIFETVGTDKLKRLALDGIHANVKMNNRNAEAFIRANKHSDYMLIGVAICVVGVIALLAINLDFVHSPMINEMRQNFITVINNTQYRRP